MKKISVIVPVYNREDCVKKCIESILLQTYKNLEIIIIDDGSSDNSGKICDELASNDDRIKVIHKVNGGLGAARNTGIENATGEYIAFVDGDDWIVPDMYEYLYNLAEKYDADICAADLIFTSKVQCKPPKVNIIESVLESDEKLKQYFYIGMKKMNNQYSACNKLYNIQLFDDIRFPIKQLFEDVATNYKLIDKANRFIISNKPVYFYYQKSTSITRKQFNNKDFDLIKVGRQILELSKKKSKEIKNYAKMYYASTFFSLLLKIKIYGIDENFKDIDKVNLLKKYLKKYYTILQKSKLPLYRKIIIFMMVKCETMIDIVFKCFRKLMKYIY